MSGCECKDVLPEAFNPHPALRATYIDGCALSGLHSQPLMLPEGEGHIHKLVPLPPGEGAAKRRVRAFN